MRSVRRSHVLTTIPTPEDTASTDESLLALTDPGTLQSRLRSVFGHSPCRGIRFGLLYGSRSATAALDDSKGHDAVEVPLPTGCLAKLLTTTLVRARAAGDALNLDEELWRHLDSGRLGPALGGIRINHLFDHTHGMDDSAIARTPLRSDGSIDIEALVAQLTAAARIAEPGEVYSYSNAGSWLLSALLERLYERPYAQILRTELFDPLNISLQHHPTPLARPGELYVCPASGGTLALSVRDTLSFLKAILPGGVRALFDSTGAAPSPAVPLPGWHSIEQGVQLGWKDYGSGWLGHTSEGLGTSALIRIHPARRIGVVVAADSHSPMAVASALLGKLLPGFVSLRMPKLLARQDVAQLAIAQYTGVYSDSRLSIDIAPGQSSPLQLQARHRRDAEVDAEPFFVSALQAAQNHIFFPVPADAVLCPFVQFVESRDGTFRYLWNGKNLRRAALRTSATLS